MGNVTNSNNVTGASEPSFSSGLPHPLSPEEEFPSMSFQSPENGKVLPASSLFMKNQENDVHVVRGQFMTPEDVKNIQVTINEFLGKAVLPYVERQARLLHETVNTIKL